MAYANTNNPASATGHGSQFTEFLNADATAYKTILTAPAAGKSFKVTGIAAVNLDTASAYDMQFGQNDGSSDFQLTKVAVPANSGNTNAINPKDVLRGAQFGSLVQVDAAGNSYIVVPAGHSLKAKATSAIATGAGEAVQIKVDYAIYE